MERIDQAEVYRRHEELFRASRRSHGRVPPLKRNTIGPAIPADTNGKTMGLRRNCNATAKFAFPF
jgi:hypothetical protein